MDPGLSAHAVSGSPLLLFPFPLHLQQHLPTDDYFSTPKRSLYAPEVRGIHTKQILQLSELSS